MCPPRMLGSAFFLTPPRLSSALLAGSANFSKLRHILRDLLTPGNGCSPKQQPIYARAPLDPRFVAPERPKSSLKPKMQPGRARHVRCFSEAAVYGRRAAERWARPLAHRARYDRPKFPLFTVGSDQKTEGRVNTHRIMCTKLSRHAASVAWPFPRPDEPAGAGSLPAVEPHPFCGQHNVGIAL